MPTLRPQPEQVKLTGEHDREKRPVVRKRRRDIQSSGLIAKLPHVSSECLCEVVPRANVLILDDLLGIIENEFAPKRIGVGKDGKQTDQ